MEKDKVRTRRMMLKYGMRLRGFAPGCQPKKGFIEAREDPTGKYHNIIVYNRRLTDKEIEAYELDDLNRKAKQITVVRERKGMRQPEFAELLGVSIKTLQSWEIRGMNGVGLAKCLDVADKIGINVRELCDDEEN